MLNKFSSDLSQFIRDETGDFLSISYFNGLKNAVIEVWEAGILVHHAVDKFCELQQEGFAVGKAIVLQ